MNKTLILILVAALAFSYSCENAGNPESAPNILLVLVDDCSADELSCYGNTNYSTPVLDQLAADGARFETC